MGFASGSISFRRYHVRGRYPRTINEKLIERPNEHAIGTAKEASSDDTEVGWIAPTHLFDTDFEVRKVTVGSFLHLAMRLDRLGAPPNVRNSYRRIEELAALEAASKPTLSKEERREAREAGDARAEKEARTGAFRRVSAHPLIFDLESQTVYFASLAATPHDKLLTLFASTFGARLEPQGAAELALRIAQDTGRTRSFEDAVPSHLIDSPSTGEEGAYAGGEPDRNFFGREFMTWLWHELESGDGTIALPAGGKHALPAEVALMIDRTLQLDCDFKTGGRDVIYADGPAATPEAKAALRIGKQPTRMGLILSAGGEQYSLTLDAARFDVRGLKLPDVDEPHPEVRLEERCGHVVRVSAILKALYAAFLKIRFGRDYSAKLGQLRHWARPSSRPATAKTPLRLAT